MPSIIAKLEQLQKFGQDCGRAARSTPGLIRLAMGQAVGLMSMKVKEKIRDPGDGFGPLIAGKANNMFQTWTQSVSPDGLKGASFSTKIYSSVMARGRKPGARQPPREAIENWIRDKRILDRRPASRAGGKGRGKLKKSKASSKQARERQIRSLAFVFARSIGKKGIRARNFDVKAIREAEPHLARIWATVPDRIVYQVLGGQL